MSKRDRTCFVIMPFGEGEARHRLSARFDKAIRTAVESARVAGIKYSCTRADDPERPGSITAQVLDGLRRADLVVADLEGLNANVLWELGVRDALRHGTILVAPRDQNIPFDLSDRRIVRYPARGDEEKLREALREVIERIRDTSQQRDSPVLAHFPDLMPRTSRSTFRTGRWTKPTRNGFTSAMDGLWLEVLDRRENRKPVRHFSFFELTHDPDGYVHPFKMSGYSFRADGTRHSSWETAHVMITEETESDATVEYVYRAETGTKERPAGFGWSRFTQPSRRKFRSGNGHYLAGEETPIYRCNYGLYRVDQRFLGGRRVPRFEIDDLKRLVPMLARRFGRTST